MKKNRDATYELDHDAEFGIKVLVVGPGEAVLDTPENREKYKDQWYMLVDEKGLRDLSNKKKGSGE